MTGETPSTPNDDTNDRFEALVSGYWEQEPSLRDTIDAGIRRMFDEAKSLEDSLNAAHEASSEMIQESLDELNGDWDMLGYGEKTLHITGRLRPTAYAIDEGIFEFDKGTFAGLGERLRDIRGDYYSATNLGLVVRKFDVEVIPLGENKVAYRVVISLGVDEDYEEDTTWFTAYPEELEYIEVPTPSPEGAVEFIEQYYPELFDQIMALPDNCQDPELIRQSLEDLVVTIDLTKTDSTLSTEEILRLIEEVITDRLAFDDTAYTVGVRGIIYGRTITNKEVPTHYDGELAQVLMGLVRLLPVKPAPGDTTQITYRPALETWYLIPGSRQGRTEVCIPIDSLIKICEQRPLASQFPFDTGDLMITSNEGLDRQFEVIPLNDPVPTASRTEQQESVAPLDDTELVPNGPDRLEILAQYQQELRGLHEAVRPYVSNDVKYYNSEYEALEARTLVESRITSFIDRWMKQGLLAEIDVTGEGLIIPNTTINRQFNEDEATITISFSGMGIEAGDIMTQRRGILLKAHVQVGEHSSDELVGKYGLAALLEFFDSSAMIPKMTITDPNYGLPIITNQITKGFHVDLGESVEYVMPELARDMRRREQIEKIASLPINPARRDSILERLDHLTTAVKDLTPAGHSYAPYNHLERLRDLAFSPEGEEDVLDTVATTLEAILGVGRSLSFSGSMYDSEGTLSDDAFVGRLTGVIDTHPYMSDKQIAFVVTIPQNFEDSKEQYYIVPLGDLKALAL